tara:strand:+ start:1513 stop:2112 length:600 start_codon:yes stop_codon:yes gene_type:complete
MWVKKNYEEVFKNFEPRINYNTIEPVIKYVARLDGLSQGWDLSIPISITPSHRVKIKTYGVGDNGKTRRVFGGDNGENQLGYILHPNSQLYVKVNNQNRGETSLDGGAFDIAPFFDINVNIHTIEMYPTLNCEIDAIGFKVEGGDYMPGALYEFEVELDGVITHSIPLTNLEQGATQLPAVGDVSAFMPNYSSDVWEQI